MDFTTLIGYISTAVGAGILTKVVDFFHKNKMNKQETRGATLDNDKKAIENLIASVKEIKETHEEERRRWHEEEKELRDEIKEVKDELKVVRAELKLANEQLATANELLVTLNALRCDVIDCKKRQPPLGSGKLSDLTNRVHYPGQNE